MNNTLSLASLAAGAAFVVDGGSSAFAFNATSEIIAATSKRVWSFMVSRDLGVMKVNRRLGFTISAHAEVKVKRRMQKNDVSSFDKKVFRNRLGAKGTGTFCYADFAK
jgi:hypothetical protein